MGTSRAIGIRALPCGPRVREDRRDPLRLRRRELRDRQGRPPRTASSNLPQMRADAPGRSCDVVDLRRDGQEADQPARSIERQRHHPGTRGRADSDASRCWCRQLAPTAADSGGTRTGAQAVETRRARAIAWPIGRARRCAAGSRYRSRIRPLHRLPDPRSPGFAAPCALAR